MGFGWQGVAGGVDGVGEGLEMKRGFFERAWDSVMGSRGRGTSGGKWLSGGDVFPEDHVKPNIFGLSAADYLETGDLRQGPPGWKFAPSSVCLTDASLSLPLPSLL